MAFGGYPVLENRPADDLLVGRLIDEQGYKVVLLRYAIDTVCDYGSMSELIHKRLRWIVVMRHLRPCGHLGLLLTFGLPWSRPRSLLHPWPRSPPHISALICLLRIAMTWIIGIHGLRQPLLWKQMPLIPVWDALAFALWLVSFARDSIRWRGADYYIRNGQLVPAYRATSNTPAITASVPMALRRPIRSCSTNFASSVSSTKLADDTGTAKLSGSDCTSAINVKNDTALPAIPRISRRRLAIVWSNRAIPRALTDCSPACFISWL